MNSSISSSDPDLAWLRFARILVGGAVLLAAGLVGLIFAVDPYDTGRSALFAKPGVRPQGPRTAAASRGRDPAFDGTIIGNSHVQLLSPERLKAKSGLSFVQLSVPGSGPKEHLVLLDWFLRQRRSPAKAVVLGIDNTWCTGDATLSNWNPFPFWLFSASPMEYLRGLASYNNLEELPRRLSYLSQRDPERARPDGYWDYEPNYLGLGYAEEPELRRQLYDKPEDNSVPATAGLPAADALRRTLAALPGDLAVVLVFPPQYVHFQPAPGSSRAAADEACKAAYRQIAAARPRTFVLDWRTDRPPNRDPAQFFDQTHYRRPIAEAVESDIAALVLARP